MQDIYDFHDVVDVTCRAPPSKPLPVLSWFINGIRAPPEYVSLNEDRDELRLRFLLDVHHLREGTPQIFLSCSASMSYSASNFETLRNETVNVIGNGTIDERSPITISGVKEDYKIGENLSLRCSFHSKQHEEVFLSWKVNGVDVEPQYVIQYTYSNYSGLEIPLTKHFLKTRQQLSIKCIATRVFWKFKDKRQSSSSSSSKTAGRKFMSTLLLTVIFLYHPMSH